MGTKVSFSRDEYLGEQQTSVCVNNKLINYPLFFLNPLSFSYRVRCGHDRDSMVVGFTNTCAIIAYHH